MIITDYDNTFRRSDYTIDQSTIDTISRFEEAGGIFAVVSGRTNESILRIVRELGLKGLVASYNGTVIADIETGELLVNGGLEKEVAVLVCKAYEAFDGICINVYDINKYYASHDCEYLRFYERVTRTKAKILDEKPSAFMEKQTFSCKKVTALVEAERRNKLYEHMQKRVGKIAQVVCSAEAIVEVVSSDYSKGTAVDFYAKYYQIPKEEILCVGDSSNDLPMLRNCGKGLAVKNCDEYLKDKVEVYGYSNDENAIERIIKEFGWGMNNEA